MKRFRCLGQFGYDRDQLNLMLFYRSIHLYSHAPDSKRIEKYRTYVNLWASLVLRLITPPLILRSEEHRQKFDTLLQHSTNQDWHDRSVQAMRFIRRLTLAHSFVTVG